MTMDITFQISEELMNWVPELLEAFRDVLTVSYWYVFIILLKVAGGGLKWLVGREWKQGR